jgi:flagellar hook assembly protein FlgD
VQEETHFTYVLSHEAQVAVEIYALSGRRVLRLGPLRQGAGFQQVEWDGRDQDGRQLANGAYLYRISAEGPQGHAEFRGPLSVVR